MKYDFRPANCLLHGSVMSHVTFDELKAIAVLSSEPMEIVFDTWAAEVIEQNDVVTIQ